MEAVAAVAVVLAVIHAISVEMRLADLTRRLESAERSLDRLAKVWWEGVARRNGFSVEHGAGISGGELPEFSVDDVSYFAL